VLFSKKKELLPKADQELVVAAIGHTEAQTTGEIRVFVESHCAYVNALERTQEIFGQLQMAATERRNAILIYVALTDKQFAIWGDEAIDMLAGGAAFWERAAEILRMHLKAGNPGMGIAACIEALAKPLTLHFPYDPAIHRNELPDEIVFGK
jgi:uncharacterized membrane protein